MPITVYNTMATVLDVPGAGLIFDPGEMKTVDAISPALSAAIRAGKLSVTAQSANLTLVVAEDGQSEFDLPVPWPGPDRMQVSLNGLMLAFAEDYTIEAADNRMVWLDEEIALKAGDRIVLIGGGR